MGHAVYGPYKHLDPGDYAVEFNLSPDGTSASDAEEICATVDVAAEFGQQILVSRDVTARQLGDGPLTLRLPFRATSPCLCEFRVGVSGRLPLVIEDYCRVVRLPDAQADVDALLDDARFPASAGSPVFTQHRADLRRLYEGCAEVRIVNDDVIVAIDGIAFYARVSDDLRFVSEIFLKNTYNFLLGSDCCVIDIGMNLGLVSLSFARKECVREVHSFEPFRATYDRAMANLSLNPALAAKISAHNFGLAGWDDEPTILVPDHGDSGALSIRGADRGEPVQIRVRNAADVLDPIIRGAVAKGRRIIAKVDCEGSEFPIFEVLERRGLFEHVSALMVEWHRGGSKTQYDLLQPLLQRGFVAFDLTPQSGNGFFYAVRTAAAD